MGEFWGLRCPEMHVCQNFREDSISFARDISQIAGKMPYLALLKNLSENSQRRSGKICINIRSAVLREVANK